MLKDHTRYLGDNKPIGAWTPYDDGLSFDMLPQLPETIKPIGAWHPELCYRKEKFIDGTSHHYL